MISTINKRYFLLAVDGAKVGKSTDMDIAVRCPVCGDSHKNKNSTRLHLYHKNGKDGIQCFNGDCQLNGRVYNLFGFLKSFFPNLLENYKRENFIQNLNNLSGNEPEDVFAGITKDSDSSVENNDFGSVDSWFPESKDYSVQEIKPAIKPVLTHNLFQYFDNLIEHDEAISYLKKRGLDYFNSSYEWYFGKQNLEIGDKLYKLNDAIILPLYYGKEMYGFYSRNIHTKEFFTYMPEQNMGYKIWGWFQIDKSKPVYIFEGIFDAISSGLENCIALMGAKIPEERLKELAQPVFVLDNDKTGMLNSIEYSKRGFKVYIQPNEYREKDMNELMLNHPELNVSEMIKENIYTGISAEIRLKSKL